MASSHSNSALSDLAWNQFIGALERVRLVHSLGGPGTTLSHSVTMTHRLVPVEAREALGSTTASFV